MFKSVLDLECLSFKTGVSKCFSCILVILQIQFTVFAKPTVSYKIRILISCDVCIALGCVGSIIKFHVIPLDSTMGEMPLPLSDCQCSLVFVTQVLSVALSVP